MVDSLSLRLLPDVLREIVEPLLPGFSPRQQVGRLAPLDNRAVLTAVVYVLTSGCAWRDLSPSFGVSVPTAHRCFAAWVKAGMFDELHRQVLDRLSAVGELDVVHVGANRAGSERTRVTTRPPTVGGCAPVASSHASPAAVSTAASASGDTGGDRLRPSGWCTSRIGSDDRRVVTGRKTVTA